MLLALDQKVVSLNHATVWEPLQQDPSIEMDAVLSQLEVLLDTNVIQIKK